METEAGNGLQVLPLITLTWLFSSLDFSLPLFILFIYFWPCYKHV